jgi:cytosine/adenosine deaminase-related metal-dependent hydrolase
MAARKFTITMADDLVEAIAAAAREDGIPVSRLIAAAAERELRLRAGRKFIADWQAGHGAFGPDELAAARAEMAAADAEALAGRERTATCAFRMSTTLVCSSPWTTTIAGCSPYTRWPWLRDVA